MAEKQEDHSEAGAEKPKSKKKLVILIVVVLLLVGGGAGFFLMGGGDEKAAQHEEEQEEEVHYKTANLEPFIVNLAENNRFLKVTMLLEYDPKAIELATSHDHGGEGGHGGGSGGGGEAPAAAGGLPPELGARLPMIRDAIIRTLSSKKAEEVLTAEGKDRLKEDLVEAINEAAGIDGAIVAVYFTEFIIQ